VRTLLEAECAVTPTGGLLHDAAILIEGQRISAVAQRSDLAGVDVDLRLSGEGGLALPGFVNAHQHGIPDSPAARGVPDQPLECWLVALLGLPPPDPYADSVRVAQQMARAGITTAVHAHGAATTDPETYDAGLRAILRGYADVGVRVVLAAELRDRGVPVYADRDRFLARLSADIRDRLPGVEGARLPPAAALEVIGGIRDAISRGEFGDVVLALGPPGPPWCTDELFSLVARSAREWDMPVTTHVLETRYERAFGERAYAGGTVGGLREMGLLDSRLLAAHCVWINEYEREAFASAGASVATNPSSNLRLHAGVAPVRELLASGVNVALGTDNMALGGRDEILDELRLLCALQRRPDIDDSGLGAAEAVGLITMFGGRAIGRPDIGVLQPGAMADIVIINLRNLTPAGPAADPLTLALALATSRDVEFVIAGGRVIVERGTCRGPSPHPGPAASWDIDAAAQAAALARLHVGEWDRG
jgi:cytosine/adenosine deaminase-related metal-dependent hydrolase